MEENKSNNEPAAPRLLEGVIRIYNRSDRMVNELINGTRVIIPGKGSADVSAKRAAIMLEKFKDVLTTDPNYANRVFTDEDYRIVEELDEVHLRSCLKTLMSNCGCPDFKKAYEDQMERAKAVKDKK